MNGINIERLHTDCMAWCENPTWKPWQDEWSVRRNDKWMIVADSTGTAIATFCLENRHEQFSKVMIFAQAIGLDVESYRKDAKPEKQEWRELNRFAELAKAEKEAIRKETIDTTTLRLECLKLAVANGPGRTHTSQGHEAQQFLDWITPTSAEV